MEKNEKMVYWGYAMPFETERPEVGKKLTLTKVEAAGGAYLGTVIGQTWHETEPIIEVERIAKNMSILWTENAGYAVYWTET